MGQFFLFCNNRCSSYPSNDNQFSTFKWSFKCLSFSHYLLCWYHYTLYCGATSVSMLVMQLYCWAITYMILSNFSLWSHHNFFMLTDHCCYLSCIYQISCVLNVLVKNICPMFIFIFTSDKYLSYFLCISDKYLSYIFIFISDKYLSCIFYVWVTNIYLMFFV